MILITRNNIPPGLNPEIIRPQLVKLKTFYEEPSSKRAQQRFDFDPSPLQKVLPYLLKLFNNKCAYCETPITLKTIVEIDYFRPRNGAKGFNREFSNDHYWWLSYEWRNLYLCCQTCNHFKQAWFPVKGKRCKLLTPYENLKDENNLLIDPCNDDPSDHISYTPYGKAVPLSAKGQTTINVLKLNRSDLLKARRQVIKLCYENFDLLITKLRAQVRKRNNLTQNPVIKTILLALKDNSPVPYAGIIRYAVTQLVSRDHTVLDNIKNAISEKMASVFLEKLAITKIEKRKKNIRTTVSEQESLKRIIIKSIEIRNFKGISHLRLNIPQKWADSPNQPAPVEGAMPFKIINLVEPWVMLLGENGVGKSSILQAISLALVGQQYLNKLRIRSDQILKHGAKSGYVKINHFLSDTPPYILSYSKKGSALKTNLSRPNTCVLGYGASRLTKTSILKEEDGGGFIKVKNLFTPEIALTDYHKWLVHINKTDPKLFNWVGLALKDLLLINNNCKLVIEQGIAKIRYTNRHAENLDDLSDGYRSVLSIAVDIMKTLRRENSTIEKAQGIVLLDEIGLHLHPTWKMQIVTRLRTVFKSLQFFVTTHDPLCLRGLNEGEIAVLIKSKRNKVSLRKNLPDPSGFNAEQLLASEFFGLNSTYDWQDEEKFNEYHYLLSRRKLNILQKRRLKELEQFVKSKERIGNTPYENLLHTIIHKQLSKIKFTSLSSLDLEADTLEKVNRLLR